MSATKNVDEIFIEALEYRDEVARERYLDSVCGNDHRLRTLIDRLIKNEPSVGDFLELPVARLPMVNLIEESLEIGTPTELCLAPIAT